jgi:putative membrane protein
MNPRRRLFPLGGASLVTMASVLSIAWGCAGESSGENVRSGTTTLTAAPAAFASPAPTATIKSGSEMGAAPTYSDPQIAELVNDVNQGEIDQARYALAHTFNTDVKEFARRMLASHASIGANLEVTLTSTRLSTADSPLSVTLKSNARRVLSSMTSRSGIDFDRTYIDAQVTEQQDALDLFNTLIPNVGNDTFRDSLREIRTILAEHLSEAKEIDGSFGTR